MKRLTDEEYIENCKAEINRFERLISETTDEATIKKYKDLIIFNEDMIEITKNRKKKSHDDYFLPEYRSDGYFNSAEFKKIEAKVDEEVRKLGLTKEHEFDIIKQEILKNEYGINWLPFEKRIMPGVPFFID